MRCCQSEVISITVLLCCYKHSSGSHKHSSGRSISEAARCFRNLCVYEPNVIWKKPSASWKKKPYNSLKKPSNLWKKTSDLWHSCAANTFVKNFPNAGIIFFDAYHNLQFTKPYLVLTVCASCWHVFTATIIVSLLFCYIQHVVVCSPYLKKCRLPGGVITAPRISLNDISIYIA